jgi:hypothetical protein
VLAGKEGVEKLGLRGGKWRWWLDNQVALAYVRRGGGRVEVLERLVEEIWDGLWEMGVEIVGEGYVPSERMEADEGSREVDRGAWKTKEWVREWARDIVGGCDMDVFAGEGNAVCERFLSRWECRGSWGVNGLVKEWGERNWVVPPLSLLRVAVGEMLVRRRHCVLVVPNWAEAWLGSVLDGACWVGRLEGGVEGVVEEEEVLRGRTEVARFKGGEVGGGWLLVDWCPRKWEMGWRRIVGEPWRERLDGMRSGAEREVIVHGLSQMSCWKDTGGGWSCGVGLGQG